MSIICDVSFDKLHNDAFAGDPNSESVLRALRTAVDVGLAQPEEPLAAGECRVTPGYSRGNTRTCR